MIESAVTTGCMATGLHSYRLWSVFWPGRRDVMQHYITFTFLRNTSSMLTSPDHFLRANGQASGVATLPEGLE